MQEICGSSESLSKMMLQIKHKTGITLDLGLTLTSGFFRSHVLEGVSLNKLKLHKIRSRTWSGVSL